jgi:threonylcarbamoyladenosine tRNA methylthiotransferase MtaB
MNRRYSVAEFEQKIAQLREKVAGVRVTTDIICGFPTETDEEHAQTIETMKRIKFNAAFVFPYSRRSGTHADKMDGQIEWKVRKKRATEIIELMRRISHEN